MNEEQGKMRDRVREGLERLAFGCVNDAMRLLFCEDPDLRTLRKLDLFPVAEVKRPRGGGMEIKFVDRMQALQCLREFCGEDEEERCRLLPLYQALEQSARQAAQQDEAP